MELCLEINLILPLTKDKQKSFPYILLSSAGSSKTSFLFLFTLCGEKISDTKKSHNTNSFELSAYE